MGAQRNNRTKERHAKEIKEAKQNGKDFYEIIEQTTLHARTVLQYFKQFGWQAPRPPRAARPVKHNETIDEIVRGFMPPPLEDLGEKAGMTKEGARKYLIRTEQYDIYLHKRKNDPLNNISTSKLRDVYEYGLSIKDMAYFLNVPSTAIDDRLNGMTARHNGIIARFGGPEHPQPLTYRLASKIYALADHGASVATISEQLGKDEDLVLHTLEHRREIAPKITYALLQFFPDKKLTGPYMNGDYSSRFLRQ